MGKKRTSLNLKAGEFVRVRTRDDILNTLDGNARLDALPFMPQMLEYCGREFRVFKRAHKTCDTISGSGGRSMQHAVHLKSVRCDGAAYGGCQAGCLIFWKEAWLERISEATVSDTPKSAATCTEQAVLIATTTSDTRGSSDPTYTCQATDLLKATRPLNWWNVKQYLEDVQSRNVRLRSVAASFCFAAYRSIVDFGIGFPVLRAVYDAFQSIRGGVRYPNRMGTVPRGDRTPIEQLNLGPGELVRIKSHDEILATLDDRNKNRGLFFDVEEVPYCGGRYRVRNRVNQIIDERTGKLMRFKNDSVLLEDVYCQAQYSKKRLFCPRAIYPMWREVWLERVTDETALDPASTGPEVG